ncbi:MAG: ATPase [Bacteroidales bacterium]|nr:ATPase [Bacteroidales bacterium]
MITSPFVYGKIASDSQFTDRKEDCASLVQDFLNQTNTIIISPRRWGKSSLVKRAGKEAMAKDKNLRLCYLDVFNVRTEDEFYDKLARCVIEGTSGKFEEIFSTAMKYAATLVPSIVAGDVVNTWRLEFKMGNLSRSADEILDLAEKIARDKGIHVVVCIDEFQQISNFKDSVAFQAKLRAHWQLQQHVAYCLYGSRRHMMLEVFTHPDQPFYQFGKTIFLQKIAAELWPSFIADKFKETGKEISPAQCRRIVELVDNNPYYVQQLSEEVWNRTGSNCADETVEKAFEAVVNLHADLNLALTQTLTISQQNLLHAIVDGVKELTSAAVMSKYELKNSLTVQRAKAALVKMDIIDNFGKAISMEDPVYAYWLREIYFSR